MNCFISAYILHPLLYCMVCLPSATQILWLYSQLIYTVWSTQPPSSNLTVLQVIHYNTGIYTHSVFFLETEWCYRHWTRQGGTQWHNKNAHISFNSAPKEILFYYIILFIMDLSGLLPMYFVSLWWVVVEGLIWFWLKILEKKNPRCAKSSTYLLYNWPNALVSVSNDKIVPYLLHWFPHILCLGPILGNTIKSQCMTVQYRLNYGSIVLLSELL